MYSVFKEPARAETTYYRLDGKGSDKVPRDRNILFYLYRNSLRSPAKGPGDRQAPQSKPLRSGVNCGHSRGMFIIGIYIDFQKLQGMGIYSIPSMGIVYTGYGYHYLAKQSYKVLIHIPPTSICPHYTPV